MERLKLYLNKNTVPITFISLIIIIFVAPLVLIYFLSFFITDNSTFTNKDLKGNLSQVPSKVSNLPANQVQKKPQTKTVVPTTSKAESETTQTSEEQTIVTTPPPLAVNPPPPPPPQTLPSEIEFIGTVTGVNGNIATFNYGTNQTVNVTLTRTSPSNLTVGTRAHVHAVLRNGFYFEDEIEIL